MRRNSPHSPRPSHCRGARSNVRLGSFADFLPANDGLECPTPRRALDRRGLCCERPLCRASILATRSHSRPAAEARQRGSISTPLPDAARHLQSYKPAVIDWPKLDQDARDRLVALPIWTSPSRRGPRPLTSLPMRAPVRSLLNRRFAKLNAFRGRTAQACALQSRRATYSACAEPE